MGPLGKWCGIRRCQQAGWSRPEKVIPSREPLLGIRCPPLTGAEGAGRDPSCWSGNPGSFTHQLCLSSSISTVRIIPVLSPHGLPRGHSGKEPTCQCRRPVFHPWVGKIPWRREWLPTPTPIFLPGKCPGQRSLADCSPWGRKELDTT